MALRPVPWAIGNGAENSVELARAAAYAGTSGATGIIEPPDLRVTALPTPGAAVRVLKGTGIIKSTYAGVFGQSYVVQEQSYTDVPVAATGSSGGATKYVYVLITDTQYGGQTPPSVENGPYNDYAVTTTLPATQPYLLLAKIVQPASTATITGAMITDVRKVAIPRRENVVFARPRLAADDDPKQNYLSAFWDHGSSGQWFGELFPGGWGSTNMAEIDVPEWATFLTVRADWLSVRCESGKNAWGRYWIEYGDQWKGNGWGDGRNLEFVSQQFNFNTQVGDTYNTNWSLMDQLPVPKKLRGKTIQFAFKAGRANTSDNQGVFMNSLSGLGLDITFAQNRINEDTL